MNVNVATGRQPGIRRRISTRLYAGIAGAVALTFIAAIVGWVSFQRVGEVQNQVRDESVPALVAAFQLARQSATLATTAPRLTAVASPQDLAGITGGLAQDRTAFRDQLAILTRTGETAADPTQDTPAQRLAVRGRALDANVEAVLATVLQRFSLNTLRSQINRDLTSLRVELSDLLIPAIDDQLFYTMTGYRQLGAPPAPRAEHLSEAEFGHYRRLAELHADATLSAQILATAFNLQDPSLLGPLRERFNATARGIERRLQSLGMTPLRAMLGLGFSRLIDLGTGPERGLFALRERELDLEQRQQELLASNRALAFELVTEAENLVSETEENAHGAADASERALTAGRNTLLVLSVIALVGAVLIAWLFVGRVLVRRLNQLSEQMRRMAAGELEQAVEISGQDEVADMASALEVFRRHALEVQRLNLVERLAEELSDKNGELEQLAGELGNKNSQLETTLTDLRHAQDQIVVKEKLAALGELVAGVAHEIRNPLNFVKNFSEGSEELLEEFMEEIQDILRTEKEGTHEDKGAVIEEIRHDLAENLKTIREHTGRADRIVESMLQMGRGSGEVQTTDVNALVDEHARLAWHSARATDRSFQMELNMEFDPEAGNVEAVPQDLGRVFLNIVNNACHATDQKRRALKEGTLTLPEAENGSENGRYIPALLLTTRGTPDHVEVRARDNGTGIPPDIVEKIFNPFFTTKAANQGTGLGLALSSDILRQHGASIRVETEPGLFTEMIIEIPREGAALADENPADETDPLDLPDKPAHADLLADTGEERPQP